MTDLALVWDATAYAGDLRVDGADLGAEGGIRTAVLLSLLSDRRAESGDLPAGATDRRGWWGDTLAAVDGDRIGSRLWLLGREARRPGVVRRAEEYAREALAWLLDDGVAERVDVAAEDAAGVLLITVVVSLADGSSERITAGVGDAV